MFTEFDRLAMTRALALAERGLDTTHPNPRVGCVIAKGDRIIGEGFHERAGEPHAEVMALRSAKEPVAGATAYVTLEPCSHHGRTPPCVNALIEARIGRVVFAVQDPNPRVSGQGADALLRAGITVEAGLMQNEATELNIGFMKRMKEGLPWVRVKLAMSLDGRTALANGASQWITGEPARADVQRWRARCSAVMTGVGTVLADDPQLNVRLAGFKGRQPLRVVLDARLRSPVGAKLFAGLGGVGSAGAGAAGAGSGRTPGAVAGAGVAAAAGAGGAAVKAGAIGAGVAAAAAVTGGDVVIFTAADGGLSAAAAAAVDSSKLPDDMAELVSAFEMSPNSVAARTDDVAGSVSVKADARSSASASAGASTKATAATAPTAVPGTVMDLMVSAAPAAPPIKSADTAPAGVPGASPVKSADPAPAPAANWSVRTPVAEGAATLAAAAGAPGVSPPVVAAAGDVAGVAPTSDDATWAGAALSGAIPVKPELDAVSDGATPSSAPTAAASANDASPPPPGTPVAVSATPGSEAALRARAALLANATIGDTVLISNPAATAAATSSGANTTALADAPAAASAGASSGTTAATKPTVAPAAASAGASSGITAATKPTVAPTSGGPAHSVTSGPATGGVSAKPAVKQDSAAAFQVRKAALAAKGVRIEEVASDDGFLDLFAVLKKLGEMEVNEVLVEAGPTLAGQLLTTFLVDELLLYVAPKLLGPQGRPLVNLPELQSLQDAWGFSLFDAKRFGDDLRLRMRPK
ncbi:MAG TPA: bifunctional diaminohydroxyphosphoribosylaminopyrimidine deaminase/5-amino-6-(5-phosphoribosylamino)uracil reductase RibD [Steroidobacteraceae bacterium]